MQPVLFSILGFDIQTYGLSKAVAAIVAAFLLGRAFRSRGLDKDVAHSLVLWSAVWGFAGAKVYYLLEQMPTITAHDLGGSGFTWFGGLIGGVTAALIVIRRNQLPLGLVAGLTAIPLTVAYGIGRIGCLVSGDGTYGRPSDLPWAMSFPNGMVATDVPVHPTPLYEAIAAGIIALALWRLWRHLAPAGVFGAYLILSGAARLLVEFLRINETVLLGLTQPQLWSIVSILAGTVVLIRLRTAANTPPVPPAREVPVATADASS